VVFLSISTRPAASAGAVTKAVGSDHYIVARAGGPRDGAHLVRLHCLAYHRRFEAAVGGSGWTVHQGKLISDGLERYDEIAAQLQLLHFGCLRTVARCSSRARKVSQLPSSARWRTRPWRITSVRSIRSSDKSRRCRNSTAARGNPALETVRRCVRKNPTHPGEVQSLGGMSCCPAPRPNSALGKALGTRAVSAKVGAASGAWRNPDRQ